MSFTPFRQFRHTITFNNLVYTPPCRSVGRSSSDRGVATLPLLESLHEEGPLPLDSISCRATENLTTIDHVYRGHAQRAALKVNTLNLSACDACATYAPPV